MLPWWFSLNTFECKFHIKYLQNWTGNLFRLIRIELIRLPKECSFRRRTNSAHNSIYFIMLQCISASSINVAATSLLTCHPKIPVKKATDPCLIWHAVHTRELCPGLVYSGIQKVRIGHENTLVDTFTLCVAVICVRRSECRALCIRFTCRVAHGHGRGYLSTCINNIKIITYW